MSRTLEAVTPSRQCRRALSVIGRRSRGHEMPAMITSRSPRSLHKACTVVCGQDEAQTNNTGRGERIEKPGGDDVVRTGRDALQWMDRLKVVPVVIGDQDRAASAEDRRARANRRIRCRRRARCQSSPWGEKRRDQRQHAAMIDHCTAQAHVRHACAYARRR